MLPTWWCISQNGITSMMLDHYINEKVLTSIHDSVASEEKNSNNSLLN